MQRVILIEGCSGVQVGRENEQYSVYQVSLPELELASPGSLAEALLDEAAPWAGDLFSHDAPRLRFRDPSGRRRSGAHRISAAAEGEGDTMVLVRDSSGVQVGDHNVQRNQFRIRADSVEVEADDLGLTAERAGLVARLQTDPGDRSAARKLAESITEAAAIDLEVTLSQEIADTVGPARIEGWPDAVRDRTGVQVGDDSEADAHVEVRVLKWNSAVPELTSRILEAAASLEPSPSEGLDDANCGLEPIDEAEIDDEADIELPGLS